MLNKLDIFLYKVWFKLWFESLDNSLRILRQTSFEENNSSFQLNPLAYIKSALWLLTAILMTPMCTLTYAIWFVVFRKLLRFDNFQKSFRPISHDIQQAISESVNHRHFEVLSANVCLLPDSLSKDNNLGHTEDRIESIGNLLNQSEPNTFCIRKFPGQENDQAIFNLKPTNDPTLRNNADGMAVKVIDDFLESTDPAFVCLQEVWSIDTALRLNELLHKKYSFIVFDAGTKTFALNKYIGFESGLLIASKYPILDASFNQFTKKSGLCTFTSKGVLVVKVLLGTRKPPVLASSTFTTERVVGFIANTHLQSYQENDDSIHWNQLHEMRRWIGDFKKTRYDPAKEKIAFDIVCGDFNVDNMSPVDKRSYEHEIWQEYQDPLVLEPGIDHSLAIGTEMRYYSLYHPFTSCPKKFKIALEHERLRRIFILDANIEKANSGMCKIGAGLDNDGLPLYIEKMGGNRRVDRIAFNRSHQLNLVEYNFIANFTRLTDHIPILLKFKANS